MHEQQKIYTIGGDDGSIYFVSVEEYDPATDTCMASACMRTARTGLGVVEGGNGKLHAIGGWNNAPVAAVEEVTLPAPSATPGTLTSMDISTVTVVASTPHDIKLDTASMP